MPVASIVDEHIKAADLGHHSGRGLDRRVIGDVHLHEAGTEGLGCRSAPPWVTRRHPNLVACAEQAPGGLIAHAPASPGDERRCHGHTVCNDEQLAWAGAPHMPSASRHHDQSALQLSRQTRRSPSFQPRGSGIIPT